MQYRLCFLLLLALCFAHHKASAQSPTPTVSPKVGVNTNNPSENLHVNGTARIGSLPFPGYRSIYTKPDGTAAGASNQMFTPTSTVVADYNGVLGKSQFVPASFFYMPSTYLPTNPEEVKAPVSYNLASKVYSLDLFQEYKSQYGLSGSSTKSPGASQLPTEMNANQLYYFVTYYDNAVYENVAVNAAGLLTYRIKDNAPITAKSYMNIVLRLK